MSGSHVAADQSMIKTPVTKPEEAQMFDILARTFRTATRTDRREEPRWDAPRSWFREELPRHEFRGGRRD